jgi:hypothetical protein
MGGSVTVNFIKKSQILVDKSNVALDLGCNNYLIMSSPLRVGEERSFFLTRVPDSILDHSKDVPY